MNESMKFANVIFQKCSLRLWDPQFFTIFMWNRVLAAVSRAFFADLISQKCSERDSFWKFLSANRALATTLVRILLASSSKNAAKVTVFEHFQMQIQLSLQCRTHFADLIFQKRSETDSFWTFSNANRALATVSCAFCRQRLQIEARNWARPWKPLYPKKRRVSHPRVFSSLNSCVPTC